MQSAQSQQPAGTAQPEGPFTCSRALPDGSQCGASFANVQALNAHMKVHKGEGTPSPDEEGGAKFPLTEKLKRVLTTVLPKSLRANMDLIVEQFESSPLYQNAQGLRSLLTNWQVIPASQNVIVDALFPGSGMMQPPQPYPWMTPYYPYYYPPQPNPDSSGRNSEKERELERKYEEERVKREEAEKRLTDSKLASLEKKMEDGQAGVLMQMQKWREEDRREREHEKEVDGAKREASFWKEKASSGGEGATQDERIIRATKDTIGGTVVDVADKLADRLYGKGPISQTAPRLPPIGPATTAAEAEAELKRRLEGQAPAPPVPPTKAKGTAPNYS